MKKLKLLLSLLLLSIFITLLISNQSYAAKGIIDTETIRLRKEASTDSTIIELISRGEEVEIISEQDGWYKVKYKNFTGYLSKEYVKVEEQIENSNSNEENEQVTNEQQTSQEQEQVVEENIQQPENNNTTESTINNVEKLYVLPLINYSTIYEITTEDTINILYTLNEWAYVEANGFNGWILNNKLVNKEESTIENEQRPEQTQETTQKEPTEPEEKEAYIKLEQVNFRKEANTDSETMLTLKQNTKVEVLETSGDWTKVRYNGKEGYIATRLLSDTKVEVTNRSSEQRQMENEVVEQNNNTIESEPQTEQPETKKEEQVQEVEQPTTTTTSNTNVSNKGNEIVNYAKQFLGSKYVYGGTTPKGFDCSGFTQYVYKHFGYSISRTSSAQSKNGKQVSKSELQPGDLVFFTPYSSSKGIGHVGIYIGNNQFIHASTEKTGVITSSLSSNTYQKRYVTARRII